MDDTVRNWVGQLPCFRFILPHLATAKFTLSEIIVWGDRIPYLGVPKGFVLGMVVAETASGTEESGGRSSYCKGRCTVDDRGARGSG